MAQKVLTKDGLKKYLSLTGYSNLLLFPKEIQSDPTVIQYHDITLFSGYLYYVIKPQNYTNIESVQITIFNPRPSIIIIKTIDEWDTPIKLDFTANVADKQLLMQMTIHGKEGMTIESPCKLHTTHENAERIIWMQVMQCKEQLLKLSNTVADNTKKINYLLNTGSKPEYSHGWTVSGTTPFERGIFNTITFSNIYLKYGSDYVVPDTVDISQTYNIPGDFVGSFLPDVIKQNILNEKSGNLTTPITITTSFKYIMTYSGQTFTGSKTFTAAYPMYFGSSSIESEHSQYVDLLNRLFAQSTSDTPTEILNADNLLIGTFSKKPIKTSPAGSYTVSVGQDEYMYLIVPADMTIDLVSSENYEVPIILVDTVTGTSKGDYKIYRSASKFNAVNIPITIS